MLVFFGTSPRSALFLEQAIQNGLEVDFVVSAPPQPVGKKQILTENPTVAIAKNHQLSFLFRQKELLSLPKPTVGLIFDFRRRILDEVIDIFPKGIVNVHFSKLPQYRGPAPVQATILNGDKEAWITYGLIEKIPSLASEKIDAGLILRQTSLPLDLTETTETLYQKLIIKSASEIKQIIDSYLSDRYHTCQQEGTSSYTQKLTTENCQIDWSKPPEEIERLTRAAYPEPGAWTEIQFKVQSSKFKVMRLKILKAHLENNKLILDSVQLEGKKPVTWKQFQQGYPNVIFK